MLRGIDTTFLVQAEVQEHSGHAAARTMLDKLLHSHEMLVLAPQVTAEFVHIVTDARRFSAPLSMDQAMSRAEVWWQAKEVVHAFPNEDSVNLFLSWIEEYQLGRKRLLDTLLAATYFCHGVRSIVSSNVRDYTVFGCFDVLEP